MSVVSTGSTLAPSAPESGVNMTTSWSLVGSASHGGDALRDRLAVVAGRATGRGRASGLVAGAGAGPAAAGKTLSVPLVEAPAGSASSPTALRGVCQP